MNAKFDREKQLNLLRSGETNAPSMYTYCYLFIDFRQPSSHLQTNTFKYKLP